MFSTIAEAGTGLLSTPIAVGGGMLVGIVGIIIAVKVGQFIIRLVVGLIALAAFAAAIYFGFLN